MGGFSVKYKTLLMVLCLCVGLALGSTGFCADVQGSVLTAEGALVGGMHILVEPPKTGAVDPNFRFVSFASPPAPSAFEAVSKSNGTYAIAGLTPGTYTIKLDPGATGFKSGEQIAAVGQEGLMVNWVVSKNLAAQAFTTTFAQPSSGRRLVGGYAATSAPGHFSGLTAFGEALAIQIGGTAVIAGGVTGGLCAAGGLGCGGGGAQSPSM